MNNKNKEVAFLAVGQAGANITQEFEKLGYSAFYINTSMEDLSTLTEAKHVYHLKGGQGANKDRNKSKQLLAANIDEVVSEVKNKLLEPIIFVVFSTSGGTGSGIAPLLIDLLQDETNKTIAAIAILPSQSESVKSHINSYDACSELANIEKMGCSFFLDNNKNGNKFLINTIFVGLLDSFLSNDAVSTRGNMDRAEIKEIISTKGMSIISKLGKDKAQTSNLIQTFRNNIFAPLEEDKVVKYIAIINSTNDINTDSLNLEIGTPVDIFQGFEAPVTTCVLSGLSYPYTRLSESRDKVKANQETISKNIQSVNQNKLTEGINFLDEISALKPIIQNKKSSSRDTLMALMKK
ncbi:MAG: tubulin-like doman-containing protein [Ruminiclostridium sp.]